MVRHLLLLLRRRMFWLTLLLAIWLFCSGQARAGELADRLNAFPNWHRQHSLAVAQRDWVYPNWMEGTWALTTSLKERVAPLAPDIVTPGSKGNRKLIDVSGQSRVKVMAVPIDLRE